MSKRKHKDGRDTNCMNTTNNRNNANVNNMNNNRATYNNGPFGINPNQLLSSMFGNIDMNQINSLLQSMSTQGFDFNNLNLGNLMGNILAISFINNCLMPVTSVIITPLLKFSLLFIIKR